MEYTKKIFSDALNENIKDFNYRLQYPFDENIHNSLSEKLTSIPEQKDIKQKDIEQALTSYSSITDYNVPFEQLDDDQYSYEEGYFKAFKLILAKAYDDPQSFVMPAFFLARHYIELSLKGAITNLSIATGSSFKIGKKEGHTLQDLIKSLKNILKTNDLDIFPETFFNIIGAIDKLSPKSDEFRYPTNLKGVYNFPFRVSENECSPKLINLISLGQYVNYIYVHIYSLSFLLEDNESSLFSHTVFDDRCVKELLYTTIHWDINKEINNCPQEKIKVILKEYMTNIITNYISANNKTKTTNENIGNNIIIDETALGYQILLNGSKLFIIFKKNESWFLQTQSLFK